MRGEHLRVFREYENTHVIADIPDGELIQRSKSKSISTDRKRARECRDVEG